MSILKVYHIEPTEELVKALERTLSKLPDEEHVKNGTSDDTIAEVVMEDCKSSLRLQRQQGRSHPHTVRMAGGAFWHLYELLETLRTEQGEADVCLNNALRTLKDAETSAFEQEAIEQQLQELADGLDLDGDAA